MKKNWDSVLKNLSMLNIKNLSSQHQYFYVPSPYVTTLGLCMAILRVLFACNQITAGSCVCVCVCSWLTSLVLSPPKLTENNVCH